ncbi:heme peroxidase, partial [Pavlovales sp. CCMP2436]
QLASATALELAGGPKSPLRYGRLDVSSSEGCPPEGRLPGAYPPFPGEVDAATHLRQVFGRMGFSDSEIVALSGAHTLGRAFKERSGVVSEGYGMHSTPLFLVIFKVRNLLS